MAFIIPENLRSRRDVPNAVRQTASAFQIGLGGDATAWYEPLYDPSGTEPHFVVSFPDRGIAVMEILRVKSGGLLGVLRGKIRLQRDGDEIEADNPLSRAENLAKQLKQRIASEPRIADAELKVGAGAIFTTVSRDEAEEKKLGKVVDLERCLFSEDIKEAVEGYGEDRLMKAFTRIIGPPSEEIFSEETQKILHGLIQPEAVIDNISSSEEPVQQTVFKPPSDSEGIIRVMDRKQEAMAKNLGDGHRVIRGVAGSGKTLVLVYRARLLSRMMPKGRIIVTCFTRSLAAQLRTLLSGCENVDVINLDKIKADTIRSAGFEFPGYEEDDDGEAVNKLALKAQKMGGGPRYQAVLLDEAQDFSTDSLRFAVGLLDSGCDDLLVVADAAQNIFRRDFSWKQAGIHAQGRTQILRINYRNTKEILAFASRFLLSSRDLEPEDVPDLEDEHSIIPPESAKRTGPFPKLRLVGHTENVVAEAAEDAANYLQEGADPKSVAVLYPSSRDQGVDRVQEFTRQMQKRGQDVFLLSDPEYREAREDYIETDCPVILSSIYSAKGLEFPHVILCGVWSGRDDAETNRKLAYVGMTRAMESLTVVSRDDHPLASDLKQASRPESQTHKGTNQKAHDQKTSSKKNSDTDKPQRAGESWTKAEDQYLQKCYNAGLDFDEIAKRHRRTTGAIKSRLQKLGLVD